MATYLQGVTDYIPQFQPFQPDLNFYANALQTKQNQYDTNYKALNNVYGQYFYADLTHGDNIKKKDELLKAIDFNLKRVSGLDLSLEQNVEQAKQVFKPFYEDKYLMKDMAWTKNTNSQRAYAAGLKNARDEKMRAQYWDEGLRAIDYKTEEFKNSSIDETMNFNNVSYTPYINIYEKAQKIAKEAGFDLTESPIEFTADGKFMVKTTGGLNILKDLNNLLFLWDSVGSIPCKMTFDGKGGKQHNAAAFADKIGMGLHSRISKSKKEDYPYYNTMVVVNQPWVELPDNPFGQPEIKAKGARNKGNVKDGGLDAAGLAQKFGGRGALEFTFVTVAL